MVLFFLFFGFSLCERKPEEQLIVQYRLLCSFFALSERQNGTQLIAKYFAAAGERLLRYGLPRSHYYLPKLRHGQIKLGADHAALGQLKLNRAANPAGRSARRSQLRRPARLHPCHRLPARPAAPAADRAAR